MDELLIEAYDLIPELTRAVISGLKHSEIDNSLIRGVECLLRLQHSASMSYSTRAVSAGTLAGIVKECKALLVEIEDLLSKVSD